MDKIKVILADDQPLITESFKVMIETRADDIEVIGAARDGLEVLSLLETLRPDVIVMDVRMPRLDGVEATKLVRERYPSVEVIMLTTFEDDACIAAAVRYGAAGYLLKDSMPADLLSAIRMAKGASTLLPRKAMERLMSTAGPAATAPAPAHPFFSRLSQKEVAVLGFVARGMENKEIAAELHMTEQSVKNLVSRIYQKIEAGGRRDARRIAAEMGLAGTGRVPPAF